MPEIVSTASERDYFLDLPNSDRLAFVFTLTCNIRCAHCLVRSGPERKERMALADVLTIVDAAVRTGTRVFYVTGGEPFLFQDDLLAIVARIRALGAHSVVETNCYWARTPEVARSTLRRVVDAGADCIAVSIDAYHADQAGNERSVLVAELCLELGVPCRVTVVASANPAEDAATTADLDARGIPYFYETLMVLGRGADVARAEDVALQRGRCDSIGRAVVPNGDLFGCFGATDDNELLKRTPLFIGNLLDGDPDELLGRERGNVFSATIDREGHDCLVALLREKPGAAVPEWGPKDSICTFCQSLLSDADNVTWLADRLAGRARALP